MEMPLEFLEEMLGKQGQMDQLHAIRILDAIVQGGFFCRDPQRVASIKARLARLLCQEEKRAVIRLCAQLCGSILSTSESEDFKEQVVEAIKKWQDRNKDDVFVDALSSVATRNAPILSTFAKANLNLLRNLYGTLRVSLLVKKKTKPCRITKFSYNRRGVWRSSRSPGCIWRILGRRLGGTPSRPSSKAPMLRNSVPSCPS